MTLSATRRRGVLLLGLPDDAHPALAEQPEDAVPADRVGERRTAPRHRFGRTLGGARADGGDRRVFGSGATPQLRCILVTHFGPSPSRSRT